MTGNLINQELQGLYGRVSQNFEIIRAKSKRQFKIIALNEGYRFEFDKGGNSFPLNNFYSIVNELYLLPPDAAQSYSLEMNNFEDHI